MRVTQRVCMNVECYVIVYQTFAYKKPDNQACPYCGKIGAKKEVKE